MNFPEAIKVSTRALYKNKMRSVLTGLGVIIGIAAVVALVSIGQGVSKKIENQISSLGSNLLMVLPGSTSMGGIHGGFGSVITLMPSDANAIASQVPDALYVSAGVRWIGQTVYQNQNWATTIMGVGSSFPMIRDWPIAEGNFFDKEDVDAAANVCAIGQVVQEQLFGGIDPIGKIIKIKNLPFRVVAVMAPKGTAGFGQDQDDTILAPYTTIQKKILGIDYLNFIFVKAISSSSVDAAQNEIEALLRQRHNIKTGSDDDFTIRNVADMLSAIMNITSLLTIFLGSIASISLIVGGIGIMNIMLVSVTERTREIGIRMAVGAKRKDILLQFLLEAVTLSTIGGIIGIILGSVLSLTAASFIKIPISINVLPVAIAFFFSFAVGVFFGLYPATKASKLNPIEALRYE
ncbi:MAG: ABC transporter permease [Deltaproteobacteria bacterium]|nr:ABC transporter permease [Deltaproteobacteria bacterium]MCL5277625.1 ABC transporter permease [Deltaproteobacteria bacterium]